MADSADELLSRPLSVHFETRHIGKINHNEVLSSISSFINKNDIKAIQITASECIISLQNEEVKNRVILHGLRINNTSVYITDVDKIITNVTVKDAPYEMSDLTLLNSLSKFGEVIEGSVSRGKIKGTNIENGTRYLKILNCVPLLPHTVDVGQFTVRLFADNNRTACKYCGATNHAYFKCKDRPQLRGQSANPRAKKSCYNCQSENHVKRDCPFDTICRYCQQEGHSQNNCPNEKYGEYAAEILEGQNANTLTFEEEAATANTDDMPVLQQTLVNPWILGDTDQNEGFANVQDVQHHDVSASSGDTLYSPSILQNPPSFLNGVNSKVKNAYLIIGDSNSGRLNIRENNIYNKSVPGLSFETVDNVIDSVILPKGEELDGIVIHLGTNDVAKFKCDKNTVVQKATCTLTKVAEKWPKCPVAFSSVIPRAGKSAPIKRINSTAKFVNDRLLDLCKKTDGLHYLDNDVLFLKDKKPNISLYDAGDPTGIHVSDEGAEQIYMNMTAFLFDGMSDE